MLVCLTRASQYIFRRDHRLHALHPLHQVRRDGRGLLEDDQLGILYLAGQLLRQGIPADEGVLVGQAAR